MMLLPRPRSMSPLGGGGGGGALSALLVIAAVVVPLLSLLLLPVACYAAPESDRVTSLPGWGEGNKALPSAWYSGYLEYELPAVSSSAGGDSSGGSSSSRMRTIHTHYIYVEKQTAEDFGEDLDKGLDDDDAELTASTVRRVREQTLDDILPHGDDGGGDDEENDADVDTTTPLIFWSNGGPGASSLFGLLTELGPLLLNDDSLHTDSYRRTGVPTLLPNPSSWNTLGSLLIFDAPAPVGFSYCDDRPRGDGLSCGGWNDESASENNYRALGAFYDKFPELKTRPLYLTGESYAGIYVPRFAKMILEHNAKNAAVAVATAAGGRAAVEQDDVGTNGSDSVGVGDDLLLVPLRGFAVGDACTGTEVNCGPATPPWYDLEFVHGHGQISLKLHRRILRDCGVETLMKPRTQEPGYPPKCAEALSQIGTEMGGFYEYSLYDDCTYRNGILRKRRWRNAAAATAVVNADGTANDGGETGGFGALWADLHGHVEQRQRQQHGGGGGALNDYACGGGPVMERYVRLPSVRSALNVPRDANFFTGDDGVGFNYTATERNLLPFYGDVARGIYDAGNGGVHPRVLVYNGDTDPAINSFVAENWTSHLGLDEAEGWRPWTIDGCRRMGGYVTRYEGDLDFLTIRGAGHMVPTYKPEASLAFLASWIGGDEASYPKFDPQCPHP